MKAEIKLGQRVKDKVTEFTGIAVARCTYLNGCIQIHVSPKVDNNGSVRNMWIDEIQLEIVDNGILPAIEPRKKKQTLNKISTARNYRKSSNFGGERSHPND